MGVYPRSQTPRGVYDNRSGNTYTPLTLCYFNPLKRSLYIELPPTQSQGWDTQIGTEVSGMRFGDTI